MTRFPRRPILLLATALLGVGLIAPVSVAAGDPCFHDLDRPAPGDDAVTTVKLDDCTFMPAIARVDVGDEVRFLNSSSQAHEVLGAHLTWGAYEKLLEPGDALTVSFDAAGTYPYTCRLHPGMTGAIVVGDGRLAGGAGAAGTTEGTGDAGAAAEATAAEVAAAEASTRGTLGGLVVLAGALGLALLATLAGRRRPVRSMPVPDAEGRPG